MGGADAEVAAEGRQVLLRHRHRDATEDHRDGDERKHEIGRPAQDGRGLAPPIEGAAGMQHLRRTGEKERGQRNDDDNLQHAIGEHGVAPAHIGNGALEERGPDRAGEIAAARDQGERGAAPAIEPPTDINVERRVHAADAEEAHEQALPGIELPGGSAGREREPRDDHQGAEQHRPAHADALGDLAHDNAARAVTDPGERCRERGDRTLAAHLRGDRLERDHGDPGRAEGHSQDRQHDDGDDPRGPSLDRLELHGVMHSRTFLSSRWTGMAPDETSSLGAARRRMPADVAREMRRSTRSILYRSAGRNLARSTVRRDRAAGGADLCKGTGSRLRSSTNAARSRGNTVHKALYKL